MVPENKFKFSKIEKYFLYLKTTLILCVITLGLKLVSFQALHSFLLKILKPKETSPKLEKILVYEIAQTVMVISRYIPGAKCLSRALATQILLRRWGYLSDLYMGFIVNKIGRMSAHAWLEDGNQIIIGNTANISHYIVLPKRENSYNSNQWHSLAS